MHEPNQTQQSKLVVLRNAAPIQLMVANELNIFKTHKGNLDNFFKLFKNKLKKKKL